jgi:hypothetical protein
VAVAVETQLVKVLPWLVVLEVQEAGQEGDAEGMEEEATTLEKARGLLAVMGVAAVGPMVGADEVVLVL